LEPWMIRRLHSPAAASLLAIKGAWIVSVAESME